MTTQVNEFGEVVGLPAIERAFAECLDAIRRAQAQRGMKRLDANRVAIYVWPVLDIPEDRLPAITQRIAPLALNAGLEEITILATIKDAQTSQPRRVAIRFSYSPGAGVVANVTAPPTEPLRPLDEYAQKVQRSQARGTVYPYELIPLLTGNEGTSSNMTSTPPARAPSRPSVWPQHRRPHGWHRSLRPPATPRA